MELLQQAWATFLANDPVELVLASLVFVWLGIKATRDMNAPMKDWKWETITEPEKRIDSMSTGGTVRRRRKRR